jgi:hypothetical protein
VLTGWNFDATIYVGVAPDGASMKVFFIGSGCPLFVIPIAPELASEYPVGTDNAASDSGGGRFKGIMSFVQ